MIRLQLKIYIITLFLEVSTLSVSFGQSLIFNHLTIGDGLSNNAINAIIQNREGFIWVGTDDGLNRYDGYSFKTYRHILKDSSSISDNGIWCLLEDRSGFIWIGTKNGKLNRYDPFKDIFKHWLLPSDIVRENSIRSLFEDHNGFIWIGTYKSGLYRFDPTTEEIKHWKSIAGDRKSLSNNYVTGIVEDSDYNIWISTYNGFNKLIEVDSEIYFEKYFKDSLNENSISSNIIWSITKSKIDPALLWLGTSEGLTSFNTKTKVFKQIPIPNPAKLQFGESAGNVIEEFSGNKKILWADSYAGLLRIDLSDGRVTRFINDEKNPKSIISNQINGLLKDRSGVIWIVTQNGISYFSEKSLKFNNLQSASENGFDYNLLNNKSVNAITLDSHNTIWFGTNKGLYFLDGKSNNKFIQKYKALGDINIWSLTEGNQNELWIGTYGYGIVKLHTATGRIEKINPDLPQTRVASANFNRVVYSDNKKDIWVGYWGIGLGRINSSDNKFEIWQNAGNQITESLSHNDVWAIYQDRKGRMWIGTNGGGLNLLVEERSGKFLKWMADDDGLSSNSINAITESTNKKYASDDKTVLWIATDNGLNKFTINDSAADIFFDNSKIEIKQFSSGQGLLNNSIKAIAEDDNGNLWVTTGKGISLFDVDKEIFLNFNNADGIFDGDFNTSSILKDNNGKIYAGSVKGLNVFVPQNIKLSSFNPPIVFTNFQIFNQPVKIGENSPIKNELNKSKLIELSYSQNVFSFEFAALDYNSSKSIQYKYFMEGFDEKWIESGSRRYVTYTNLSPGEYHFKVESTNADGVWQDNTTELKIIIASPWWATSWAYTIYVLIIVIGLYVIRRFELNRTKLKNILKMREYEAIKQKELDETKSRFFANLSHEFRTPLMLIKGPLEQLMNDESNIKNIDRYKLIHRNTENLQLLIDQLLELTQLETASIPLKAKLENLSNQIRGLAYSFKSFADKKNINLAFKSVEDSVIAWIDSDKLEKIINNLLSNALKFTPEGGSVTVELVKKILNGKKYAEITISDTGIGIPKQKIDKIFDRFYQVDDSIQRAYGGSGIGLALVKELIDLHRWEISVSSETNKGTEFVLLIPLWDDYLDEDQKVKSEFLNYSLVTSEKNSSFEENDLKDSDEIENDETANNKSSILIVEDSSDVRLYLIDLLKSDYTLFEAANGKEGITVAKEKIPDLIISDVMMPEMDGMEFCSKIKSDFLTSHIPVIMLTAKASGESKIQGLETGADDYLTKPFSSKELFVRIKNLLEQRKLLREKFSKEINPVPQKVTSNSLDEEFLQKAFSLVEKNIDNVNFDTETFAKEMFLSRMQLHRKLEAITGQTPGDFIRTFRLKRAAQLLKENRLSVTQIAYAVGYNSPSQFTRAFSKQFNCTPTEYLNT
ncbi:MAG: response regulator [Ignavibacterium sp.]|jgi:signal transduction histidine kinase/ligand-binding sensor domain-containing protein/DNA-binding response OmpR family regulator|uniref:hybrid sensor histidine kinase/response regulator transcription factor n=1 Tax=Ignavibacterium sp. TaxID=2651167 RepID=UPI00329A40B2